MQAQAAASSWPTRARIFLDEIGEMTLGTAGEAAARAAGARVRAGRRRARRSRSTSASSRDEPRPRRARSAAGTLPRGPLLPAERRPDRSCRRCATARRTSRCSSSTSWPSTAAKPDAIPTADLRGGDGAADASTTGRATCASWRTRSSERSSCRAASRSGRSTFL